MGGGEETGETIAEKRGHEQCLDIYK